MDKVKITRELANERTKVRLAKSEGFLYDTRTGHKVLEFGYNELGEQLNEVDADQIMQSVNRDAPRGNADPNHLILTEEELQTRYAYYLRNLDPHTSNELKTLIDSHRSLLSANAELSFKNQKLKESLTDISAHIGDISSKDFYYDAYLEVKNSAYKALEELK